MMRVRIDSHEIHALSTGWEVACSPALEADCQRPPDGLAWLPARVPGTAAGALRDAGLWHTHDTRDFDTDDWWFRTSFEASPAAAGEELVLCFDGIATVSDVFLNGGLIASGDSMFAAHAVDVTSKLEATNMLELRCRALAPLLQLPRKPRARWRTRLVADGNLRFYRTMLIGRAPGFAPGPAAVGPWRPVRLERRRFLAVDDLALRTRLEGGDGQLSVVARLRSLDGGAPPAARVELAGPSGSFQTALRRDDDGSYRGELHVPQAARWWPHTHDEPVLHAVRLVVDSGSAPVTVDAGRVGFRRLAFGDRQGHDVERDGIDLHVNDVRVFVRGAVWTPLDPVGLAPEDGDVRAALERARAAGMNMLRIPGTASYESRLFHDLCDELGILVWQDFMFANLDYPVSDDGFREAVAHEAADELQSIAGRPSLAVLCGNSEIEQQVAMLGLDPSLGRGELFGELLPTLVREAGIDAVYVPSSPCGGELPFRPDCGIANYFGVGGYFRPLTDVRLAGVRFAGECLAFANVPDEEALAALPAGAAHAVHHPGWKAGVPRDAGSGWDFDDVRDHYLSDLYGLDPSALRRVDPERYLDLSRAVTGEVMAEVFGEWRRAGSPCGGGLVLWLRDLAPGAGWGVLDHRGEPKAAFHHLRRALAPVAVWTTDEGLGGVDVHVANDRPGELRARLRVALYRDFEQLVGEASEAVTLPPHSSSTRSVESLLGRFVDVSWAYRFGPPAQDAIVVALEREGPEGLELLAHGVRFPAGRPNTIEAPHRLVLEATATPLGNGSLRLSIGTSRLAHGVRVHVPGFEPEDDAFSVEPGRKRTLVLLPRTPGETFTSGELTALNLTGRVRVTAAGVDR